MDGKPDKNGPFRVLTEKYNEREERVLQHLALLEQNMNNPLQIFDRFSVTERSKEFPDGTFYYESPNANLSGITSEQILEQLRLPTAANPINVERASEYVATRIMAKGSMNWLGILTLQHAVFLRDVLLARRARDPLSPAQMQAVHRRLRRDAMAAWARKQVPMLAELPLKALPTYFEGGIVKGQQLVNPDVMPADEARDAPLLGIL
jgi:hypothetical protein